LDIIGDIIKGITSLFVIYYFIYYFLKALIFIVRPFGKFTFLKALLFVVRSFGKSTYEIFINRIVLSLIFAVLLNYLFLFFTENHLLSILFGSFQNEILLSFFVSFVVIYYIFPHVYIIFR